ncbi:MAG TPA: UbiA-like polyprenyltransferase [Thermodesulfobacteriota bacterium]|nr:UbiA-like polyprenyltransferase [Thermodesulfobacteriota bacterium]
MKTIITYGNFVKFSHTIFALPFVLATLVILSQEIDIKASQVILILAAMATARSAAMGINRIIDRDLDAKNPRTKNRELITGKIRLRAAWVFVIINSILFWLIASTFNWITTVGAPFILILFLIYPFLKRLTWLSHLFLGFVDGLAPTATWIALTGTVELPAVFLSLAMMFWIAGFDILYALLDIEFDRQEKLFSIPICFGVKRSLVFSAGFHALTVIFLALAFRGILYFFGLFILFIALVYEHQIVNPKDLSRINSAFFEVNGFVSIIYFVFTWLQVSFYQ